MCKSTRNKSFYVALAGFVSLGALLAIGGLAFADDTDPVLEYYWQRATENFSRMDPIASGLSYSLTAKSYRHSVGEAGRIARSDSALQTFYYSNGNLDSVITQRGKAGKFEQIDLVPPTVFSMPYHRSLFPNDTGGTLLPIELVADSTRPEQPEGLVVIDRYEYYLHSLYMYYPNWSGFRRYTRSFRFQMVDGYLFPDSVWTVAMQLGVFFADSYRLESQVTDVNIYSTPAATEP